MRNERTRKNLARRWGARGAPAGVLLVGVLLLALLGLAQQAGLLGAALVLLALLLGWALPWVAARGMVARVAEADLRCRCGARVRLALSTRNHLGVALPGYTVVSANPALECEPGRLVCTRGAGRWELWCRALRRGRVALNELQVRTSYPLGVVEHARQVETSMVMVIWPAEAPVETHMLPRQAAHGGEWRVERGSMGGDGETGGSRYYRRGDSIRDVHWGQTVRHRRLVVRDRHSSAPPGVVVVLDTRRESYADEEEFEHAVRIAAGFVEWAMREARRVTLRVGAEWVCVHNPASREKALDLLAVCAWGSAGIDLPPGAIVITPAEPASAQRGARCWTTAGESA